jgi:hypothetical protein
MLAGATVVSARKEGGRFDEVETSTAHVERGLRELAAALNS